MVMFVHVSTNVPLYARYLLGFLVDMETKFSIENVYPA
jgi:hypothetical protein